MLVTATPRQIETHGYLRKVRSPLASKITEILISQYADPAWAMVRENVSNMYDAHLAVGTKRPAVLHAPTELNPTIVFQDFGPGMTPDEFEEFYVKPGNSTKDRDNLVLGGFGIGAQTGYAYSEAPWVIETRKDGMRAVWHAVRAADGVPEPGLASYEPTDEPAGVTVSIPIRKADIQRVRQMCQRIAEFFPLPLELRGVDPLPAAHVIMRGTHWRCEAAKHDGRFVESGLIFVVGNVPYDAKELHVFDPGFNCRLIVMVPIGSVELPASRDALMNTPHTLKALQKAIERVQDEATAQAYVELEAQPTEWAAMVRWQELIQLRIVESKNPTWHGNPIGKEFKQDSTNLRASYIRWKDHGVRVVNLKADIEALPTEIEFDLRDRLLLNDTDQKRPAARVRQLKPKLYRGAAVHVFSGITAPALSEWARGMPVTLVSELPEVYAPRGGVARVARVRTAPTFHLLDRHYSYGWRKTAYQPDPNCKQFAVPFERGQKQSACETSGTLIELGLLNPTKEQVWGIPRTHSRLDKKLTPWATEIERRIAARKERQLEALRDLATYGWLNAEYYMPGRLLLELPENVLPAELRPWRKRLVAMKNAVGFWHLVRSRGQAPDPWPKPEISQATFGQFDPVFELACLASPGQVRAVAVAVKRLYASMQAN